MALKKNELLLRKTGGGFIIAVWYTGTLIKLSLIAMNDCLEPFSWL